MEDIFQLIYLKVFYYFAILNSKTWLHIVLKQLVLLSRSVILLVLSFACFASFIFGKIAANKAFTELDLCLRQMLRKPITLGTSGFIMPEGKRELF